MTQNTPSDTIPDLAAMSPRLIAAAPDMLAALQEVMNEWREGYGLRCEKRGSGSV